MPTADWKRRATATSEADPSWDVNEVPWCSVHACANYDGKRCMLTGGHPATICEPTVAAMAAMIQAGEE